MKVNGGNAMRYLLLCCFEEDRWEAIPELQRDGIMRRYGELMGSLHESGHHVASGRLEAVAGAITVRASGGKSSVTDGPFAETKEQLGGYHVMECADLAEAISIAERIPTIPYGGAVEVRALRG
jgi:hypothetical protein